jgi:hypothetical protein
MAASAMGSQPQRAAVPVQAVADRAMTMAYYAVLIEIVIALIERGVAKMSFYPA